MLPNRNIQIIPNKNMQVFQKRNIPIIRNTILQFIQNTNIQVIQNTNKLSVTQIPKRISFGEGDTAVYLSQLRYVNYLYPYPHLSFVRIIAKLCLPTFPRQIALYSPCRRLSVGRHILSPLILPPLNLQVRSET